MEAVVLIPCVLGLLLLPLLAGALCVRCRELPAVPNSTLRVWDPRALHSRPLPCHLSSCLTGFSSPGSYDTAASDSLTPSSIVLKRPPTVVPWPSATSYAPVTSYPSLSQPDLLPIPRSPQPHHMPSSRQDSEGANSVASYENEEPVCEDEEEEEEDYHNEGYLEVLPDSTPAPSSAVPPASVPSNPGLRDSAFSMESGEDYVNVLESEESADVSLDGSREYVNVSQELPPMAKTEPAILSSQKVEDEDDEEEEGAPDYENL